MASVLLSDCFALSNTVNPTKPLDISACHLLPPTRCRLQAELAAATAATDGAVCDTVTPSYVPVHGLRTSLHEQLHRFLGCSVRCSGPWECHPRALHNASSLAAFHTLAVKYPSPNVSQAFACYLLPNVSQGAERVF